MVQNGIPNTYLLQPELAFQSKTVPSTSYSKQLVAYNWVGILQSCSKPVKRGQMAIPIPFVAKWPFLFLLWLCGPAKTTAIESPTEWLYLSTIEIPVSNQKRVAFLKAITQ